jgi:hypothetical protein
MYQREVMGGKNIVKLGEHFSGEVEESFLVYIGLSANMDVLCILYTFKCILNWNSWIESWFNDNDDLNEHETYRAIQQIW